MDSALGINAAPLIGKGGKKGLGHLGLIKRVNSRFHESISFCLSSKELEPLHFYSFQVQRALG